jgi:hypothetical protein
MRTHTRQYAYTSMRRDTQQYSSTSMRTHTSQYEDARYLLEATTGHCCISLACAIRRAYVSIRQHMSAYVSTRQLIRLVLHQRVSRRTTCGCSQRAHTHAQPATDTLKACNKYLKSMLPALVAWHFISLHAGAVRSSSSSRYSVCGLNCMSF